MAYKVRVECPKCQHRWWEKGQFPEECPSCGYDTRPAGDVISMPALRTAVSKVADQTYRDMEKASENRVYAAAEQAGCSPSDMAGLKMTNMRDNAQIGENSVAEKVPDMGQHFAPNGAAHSGAVQQGPYPNSGSSAMSGLQRVLNTGPNNYPALERLQPGYRRRG